MTLWLLLSGIYRPLIIGFGVFSSVVSVWLIYRLGLVPERGFLSNMRPFALARYVFWLVFEIGKADWAVTKVILSKDRGDDQRLLYVKSEQRCDFAKMLYANSITITPGTITVETEPGRFIVHALNEEAGDMDGLSAMARRVCDLETVDASSESAPAQDEAPA
ncbi:Na+/H+ antiporter subunit E [Ahrensia sp. R2A130]|uniref:Na+/H+ antiporter subunit E n=1 Tax=Ahrensia sp. R2A130 TaxID=744979 RepID=UPI0001E0E0D2|nr:Na+/H+ antiporter subunit E [Ahrensia sp. R2A130]EFL88938.1 cation antiporter [Ahrensia sp. R2A130]